LCDIYLSNAKHKGGMPNQDFGPSRRMGAIDRALRISFCTVVRRPQIEIPSPTSARLKPPVPPTLRKGKCTKIFEEWVEVTEVQAGWPKALLSRRRIPKNQSAAGQAHQQLAFCLEGRAPRPQESVCQNSARSPKLLPVHLLRHAKNLRARNHPSWISRGPRDCSQSARPHLLRTALLAMSLSQNGGRSRPRRSNDFRTIQNTPRLTSSIFAAPVAVRARRIEAATCRHPLKLPKVVLSSHAPPPFSRTSAIFPLFARPRCGAISANISKVQQKQPPNPSCHFRRPKSQQHSRLISPEAAPPSPTQPGTNTSIFDPPSPPTSTPQISSQRNSKPPRPINANGPTVCHQ